MIKGVNKRILEVNFPYSPYFEKAVVFLRADRSLPDSSHLSEEARMQISELEKSLNLSAAVPTSKKARLKTLIYRLLGLLFKISVIICAAAVIIK